MSTTTPPAAPKRDHLLSDKQYFILNNLANVVFPALGTLYFAIAQIWGLPDAKEVVGSITAFDLFLGGIVKLGEASYNNSTAKFQGAINVQEQADKTVYSLELDREPEELASMDQVVFKVNKPLPPQPQPVITFPLTPPAPPAQGPV